LEIIGLNSHHTYNTINKYNKHYEKIYNVVKLTLFGGQTNNLP